MMDLDAEFKLMMNKVMRRVSINVEFLKHPEAISMISDTVWSKSLIPQRIVKDIKEQKGE